MGVLWLSREQEQWPLTEVWTGSEGTTTPIYNSSAPRFSSPENFAIQLSNGTIGGRLWRDIAPTDTLTLAFALNLPGTSGVVRHLALIGTGATARLRVEWVPADQSVQVVKASDGTVLVATAATALPANTWTYVTVAVTRSATVGTVVVKVAVDGGGTIEASTIGADTADGSVAGYDRVSVVCKDPASTSSVGRFQRIRDVMVTDDLIYRGNCRVQSLRPAVQGFHNAWTPSAGIDKPALIDDRPADDATFISSAVVGQRDSWTMTGIVADAARPHVHTVQAAMRTSTTAEKVTPFTRRGADVDQGQIVPPGSVGIRLADMQQADPHTAAVWVKADLASTEWGVRADAP